VLYGGLGKTIDGLPCAYCVIVYLADFLQCFSIEYGFGKILSEAQGTVVLKYIATGTVY
jgi:hypothetical protein